MYKCKSDLELLQCLKHLTKEQKSSKKNKKNVFTPIKKPCEEIEATLSFCDSYASLNDLKVNEDDHNSSTINTILHQNTHENNINTNFNFNYLNIEKKEFEHDEDEEDVLVVVDVDVDLEKQENKQNNILKISLDSKKSRKQEKTKKKLFCNIIAQNNLTNKVNKLKNER